MNHTLQSPGDLLGHLTCQQQLFLDLNKQTVMRNGRGGEGRGRGRGRGGEGRGGEGAVLMTSLPIVLMTSLRHPDDITTCCPDDITTYRPDDITTHRPDLSTSPLIDLLLKYFLTFYLLMLRTHQYCTHSNKTNSL